jgi:hypothetical protein
VKNIYIYAGGEDGIFVHPKNGPNGLIRNWCIGGCWFTPAQSKYPITGPELAENQNQPTLLISSILSVKWLPIVVFLRNFLFVAKMAIILGNQK